MGLQKGFDLGIRHLAEENGCGFHAADYINRSLVPVPRFGFWFRFTCQKNVERGTGNGIAYNSRHAPHTLASSLPVATRVDRVFSALIASMPDVAADQTRPAATEKPASLAGFDLPA